VDIQKSEGYLTATLAMSLNQLILIKMVRRRYGYPGEGGALFLPAGIIERHKSSRFTEPGLKYPPECDLAPVPEVTRSGDQDRDVRKEDSVRHERPMQ
jgi:hypothetical protein